MGRRKDHRTVQRILSFGLMFGWLVVLLVACQAPSPPLLPPETTVYLNRHQELIILPGGAVRQVVFGHDQEIGLCVEVEASIDTSQWDGRVSFHSDEKPSDPAEYAAPSTRLGTTLCWRGQVPSSVTTPGEVRLCLDGRDRFDGRVFELPCLPIQFDPDPEPHRQFMKDLRAKNPPKLSLDARRQVLDGLTQRARDLGYEYAAWQIEMIFIYYLRRHGTPDSLAEARRRLENPPFWVAEVEGSRWAAQVAYELATLDLAVGGRLPTVWQRYSEVERLNRRIGHSNWLMPVVRQAEILARLGASSEAVDRLQAMLLECENGAPCNVVLHIAGRQLLAWLIALDTEASPERLQDAVEMIDAEVGRTAVRRQPIEEANLWINRAYAQLHLGQDPRPDLERARQLLEPLDAGARGAQLMGWIGLVEGLHALRQGQGRSALEFCEAVENSTEFGRLAAFAAGCSGRAESQLAEFEAARAAFARALFLHEQFTARQFGQSVGLGPGQRADDYFAAAHLEVAAGNPEAAWAVLERLDRLTAEEEARWHCRAPSDPEVEAERRELLNQWMTLEKPASRARRQHAVSIARGIRTRLQELARVSSDCAPPEPSADPGARYRAFATPDELVLLHRGRDGRVTTERRSPFDRRALRARLRQLQDALADPSWDDERWRESTTPLAEALVPEIAKLEPLTTWSLHGLLQDVPLAALPMADGGWLGDRTVVALRPSAVSGVPFSENSGGNRSNPLFVIDPRGDLGLTGVGDEYRDRFPQARLLEREAAHRQALRRQLEHASWFHLDAHGVFDPAFPELSSLQLSDGPLPLYELAAWPIDLAFANLSGCQTGRWQTTADSGRYGLGGLFARRSTPWVIASRGALDNALARDFNRAFYRDLEQNPSVWQAYGTAGREIRERYAAPLWASLLLLQGGNRPERGLLNP